MIDDNWMRESFDLNGWRRWPRPWGLSTYLLAMSFACSLTSIALLIWGMT